jgi:hypothetical protein
VLRRRPQVSTAAGRHDLADQATGSYATIDFMVKLASSAFRWADRCADMSAADGRERTNISQPTPNNHQPTITTLIPPKNITAASPATTA